MTRIKATVVGSYPVPSWLVGNTVFDSQVWLSAKCKLLNATCAAFDLPCFDSLEK